MQSSGSANVKSSSSSSSSSSPQVISGSVLLNDVVVVGKSKGFTTRKHVVKEDTYFPPSLTVSIRSTATMPSAYEEDEEEEEEEELYISSERLSLSTRESTRGGGGGGGGEGGTDGTSSVRSGDSRASSHSQRMNSLQGNLMRTQKLRDPLKIYHVLEVLGEGSMGRVCRVVKRKEAVGGSARPKFVLRNKTGDCCFALLERFHQWFPKRPSAMAAVYYSSSSAPQDQQQQQQQQLASVYTASSRTDGPSSTTDTAQSSSHHHAYSFRRSTSTIQKDKQRNPRTLKKKSSLISIDPAQAEKQVVYALKSIHLSRCSSALYMDELKNEVEILKSLDHPNIVKAVETYDYRNHLYIVLELCSGGDLYTREPYSEDVARSIMAQLLSAVSYLHNHRGIVHRDLKFENIMFVNDRTYNIKLIDFGLSQKFAKEEHMHDPVGTVYTMAPELLQGDYTSQADVWSCGVIAFMLLSSSMPFYGQNRVRVIKKIIKGAYRFAARKWNTISNQAKAFCAACLTINPDIRPTAQTAQTMPWLQDHKRKNTTPNHISKKQLLPHPRLSHWQQQQRRQQEQEQADKLLELEQMDHIQTSILSFAGYSQLKKLALLIVAYKSTAEEIGFLRAVFDRFDKHGDGEIIAEEFCHVLGEHYDYTQEECMCMFRGIDVDGTGTVHYSEFLAATLEAHGTLDETRLAEAFDRLDCDDDGYITIKNLRELLGPDVPDTYIQNVMDEADVTGDHRIAYDEFMQLWSTEDDDMYTQTKMQVASRHRSSSTGAGSTLSDITGDNNNNNNHCGSGESESSSDTEMDVEPHKQQHHQCNHHPIPKVLPATPPPPYPKKDMDRLVQVKYRQDAAESAACFKSRKAMSIRIMA